MEAEQIQEMKDKPFNEKVSKNDEDKPFNEKDSQINFLKKSLNKKQKQLLEISLLEKGLSQKPNKKSSQKLDEPKDKKDVKESNEEKKVFDLFDISGVIIKDPGMKNVINLDYHLVIKSHGRNRVRFGKAEVNIIERLINMIAVPGHRGKKHRLITNWATGKYSTNAKTLIESFKIIENKTKKNPIQVLVEAIENGSPKDEVTMIQYGGARYPQAVDCSPHRRISLALRNIVHGAQDKAFGKKKSFVYALADEIIATANSSGDSVAYTKRNELEKQADAAR